MLIVNTKKMNNQNYQLSQTFPLKFSLSVVPTLDRHPNATDTKVPAEIIPAQNDKRLVLDK